MYSESKDQGVLSKREQGPERRSTFQGWQRTEATAPRLDGRSALAHLARSMRDREDQDSRESLVPVDVSGSTRTSRRVVDTCSSSVFFVFSAFSVVKGREEWEVFLSKRKRQLTHSKLLD